MEGLSDVAEHIAAILKARGETVAVFESSAGGLISAALLAVPGASAYFLGGTVLYTGKARTELLALPTPASAGMSSSSEPYMQLVANIIRERLGATWGLAESGTAGPTAGPKSGHAAGHCALAVSGPNGLAATRTLETASNDREANMRAFARGALELFLGNLSAG